MCESEAAATCFLCESEAAATCFLCESEAAATCLFCAKAQRQQQTLISAKHRGKK
ncbi:hypothetical protein [Lysinibacillus xylanilyticus]|uniref:hypothetical protein n=1 Tax=Lysinibacillus xylanilyticus TaxID=582475 RepID=UPI003D008683